MWPFICIMKNYIDRWMDAEGVFKLGLEAILKATKNHETGHWIFMLVCHVMNLSMSLTDSWL
jgi:hypothetical protein